MMRRMGIGAGLLALAACGEPAEETGAPPPMAFDTARIAVVSGADTFPLTVELAATAAQQAQGLMERASLPADRGMLFTYATRDDTTGGAFYMYRTRIPLDIAFMDRAGRIVSILSMEPCPSPYPASCRTYSPGVPFTAALEVNRDWFEERGIGVGDVVLLPEPAS